MKVHVVMGKTITGEQTVAGIFHSEAAAEKFASQSADRWYSGDAEVQEDVPGELTIARKVMA